MFPPLGLAEYRLIFQKQMLTGYGCLVYMKILDSLASYSLLMLFLGTYTFIIQVFDCLSLMQLFNRIFYFLNSYLSRE